MMKKRIKKIIYYMTGLMVAAVFLTGCGGLGNEGGKQDSENTQTESADETGGLFLVLENNTIDGTFLLYSYETGLEYYYQYNFSTKFYDKYGNYEPAVRFTAGKAVELEKRDEYGYLTVVRMSSQVWEQEKIKRFSIDEKHGVFSIGETNYSIQNKVVVFSDDKEIPIGDLSENDVLTVVGLGNRILSVNVTTGHGTLVLKNTELFDGSLLNLSDKMYAQISEGVTLELPEGVYTLTVANDGWGGSREITISRDKTTEIDLETLKGPGKKKGMISFQINVEDVKVYIDYELVDHTQAVELTYGTHTLEISAPGYESWKKYLMVNSQEATLIIELEEESEDGGESEESSEDTSTEEEKDSGTESEAALETETESQTQSQTESVNS